MALMIVSIGAAFLTLRFDAFTLTKLDSMSAADYIQYQREIHHHSFIYHFILLLIMGSFYIGIIEFITYVAGLCFKNPEA